MKPKVNRTNERRTDGTREHLLFVKDFFRRDVYVVTEYRDGAVFKTRKIGEVAAMMDAAPLRPGHAFLASHTGGSRGR